MSENTSENTIVRLINPLPTKTSTPNAYAIRTGGSRKQIDTASNLIFGQLSRYINSAKGGANDVNFKYQVEVSVGGSDKKEILTYDGKIRHKGGEKTSKASRSTLGNDTGDLTISLSSSTLKTGGAVLAIPPLMDSVVLAYDLKALQDQAYINYFLSSVVVPNMYYPLFPTYYYAPLGLDPYLWNYNYLPTTSVVMSGFSDKKDTEYSKMG